ncbi:MAG: nitrite reductase small subunit NirD [Polyangiaceae bacterium]
MSAWLDIGMLDDIPRRGARVVRHHGAEGEIDIAVFRTSSDEVFAVRNACPHRQGPLSEGIVHGCRVTCPLHQWEIDLETGEAVAPDEGAAPRYPVRVEGGRVSLRLLALSA